MIPEAVNGLWMNGAPCGRSRAERNRRSRDGAPAGQSISKKQLAERQEMKAHREQFLQEVGWMRPLRLNEASKLSIKVASWEGPKRTP